MKVSGAVFITLLALVLPLSAQYYSAGGFGNVVLPAGRPALGVNPFGNVVTPAMPQGAAAAATRNGSFGAGTRLYNNNSGYNGRRRTNSSGIYAFPVFVGGYGSGYADPAAAAAVAPQSDQPATPAAPPVVINQYFGTPPPDSNGSPEPSNFHYYQAPANDAPAPPSDTYYLIAFKDHSVYSAVAYYVEGDTLHYFTAGNQHNQASLSLVDRQLTEQLNRAHNIEVRFP